ncbi:MAG: DNA adenine methylase [Chloroflexi bacterium]|nr:DNA adenine methylase [Chloroflexota bacterium]
MVQTADTRQQNFAKRKPDPTWSFATLTQKDTRYISHGYYTYPAKFIPQLAARLIEELSEEGQTVVDPFMGSGTTAVEALVHGRRAVGVDINPVAFLVAKVKATPIQPERLEREIAAAAIDLATRSGKAGRSARRVRGITPANSRIDYWFRAPQKRELGEVLARISDVRDADVRDFLLVAFSQILKSCSIWLQRSVKPTRDPNKVPSAPLEAFIRQARSMQKRNHELWAAVPTAVRDDLDRYRTIQCADARNLPCGDGQASLVVTSPPYVTSYEYADLHQLTALWLEYFDSLPEFRKRFIGSAHSERGSIDLKSSTAGAICSKLGATKKGREVRNYFADMLECFQEMKRVLKPGGKACIVIGNTELQGVEILNAQVFAEQMNHIGFCTSKIVKREIPSKILPQTRDPHNGRFTASSNSKKVLAYPVEYILIMEKEQR